MGLEVDLTMCTLGLVLLLLTVVLSTLCSHCGRRSFELRDTMPEKGPSALISVVKLDEPREDPIIKMVQDGQENFTPWRSHFRVPQVQDSSNDNVRGVIRPSHLEAQINPGQL